MQIITDRSYHAEHSIVVLGMFDGVHIGHRVLIEKGRILAKRADVPLVVSTFARHPLSLIAPEKAPGILTTNEEKAEIMEHLGVDVLLMQNFTQEVMNTDPADYIGYLVQRFHPTDVVCGYNHHFGRKGEGTPAFLRAVGLALGFHTHVAPQITLNGKEISSTAIRRALEAGDAAEAARLLGRPYSLRGITQDGVFYCADPEKVMPPPKIYWALAVLDGYRLPVTLKVDSHGRMCLIGKNIPEKEINLEILR